MEKVSPASVDPEFRDERTRSEGSGIRIGDQVIQNFINDLLWKSGADGWGDYVGYDCLGGGTFGSGDIRTHSEASKERAAG